MPDPSLPISHAMMQSTQPSTFDLLEKKTVNFDEAELNFVPSAACCEPPYAFDQNIGIWKFFGAQIQLTTSPFCLHLYATIGGRPANDGWCFRSLDKGVVIPLEFVLGTAYFQISKISSGSRTCLHVKVVVDWRWGSESQILDKDVYCW